MGRTSTVPDKIWTWGVSLKKPPAVAELARVVGLPPGPESQPHFGAKLDELAVERLPRRRLAFARSHEVLQFGARDLAVMAGGLATRARQRRTLFKEIVIEDHGTGPGDSDMPNDPSETFLFFGGDGVTLHNLHEHRWRFEIMRQALAPDGRLVLMHCWAFSDGGALALELSRIVRCPVLGMNGAQLVDDQRIQGPVFRAFEGRVGPARSSGPPGHGSAMSPWVVNFD